MEARDSGEQLSQQLCSNCDTSPSKFWCLDCNGSLCGDCELAHRRVSLTRSHRLRNQPQSVARILAAPVKYCRRHMSEPLELYCFTCEQFTCKDCQLTTHKSHSFEFVSKALSAVRRQLQASVQPLSAQNDTLTKTVQDMESRLEYIQVTKTQLRSNLLNCYLTVVHGLKDKVSKIFNDIVEVFMSESNCIKFRLNELKLLQQKYATLTETSEKCKTATDLQILLDMKKQIESDMKDILDQDLSPPSNMCRVTVRSCSKTTEFIENFFKVDVSWIPFSGWQSSGQNLDPPPPACRDGTPLTSNSPSYPSLHNLKPRGYTPHSSSSNPSSSSSSTSSSLASPQTSSNALPAPCRNPPQSTPTSKATSSLPHAGSSSIPTSQSSHLVNLLRHHTKPSVTYDSSSSASSFPPFTCSATTATTTHPVRAPAEQLRPIVQPSRFTFNVVPRSDLLSKHQTPLPVPLPTPPPAPPPRQAAPSQNQQPVVQHTSFPGAITPVFCLTNICTPPTVVIPAHSQSGWIPTQPTPLSTKPLPTYPGQTPIVAFSMAPQLNPVDGVVLGPMGQVMPAYQALPAPGNLVPLSGSTFLQQTPTNQVTAVPSAGPSSHQQFVSKKRYRGLKKTVSCQVSKFVESKLSMTMLEQTKPTENRPSTTVSEQTKPTENRPSTTVSEQTKPTENRPSTTVSEQTKPTENRPSTTVSEQTEPTENRPSTTVSEQTEPTENRPSTTVSAQTEPTENRPSTTVSEQTKPTENRPSTTVSAQTEPAEEKPTSTLPEETDSMENEPTSTTADKPDPPPDKSSTTTSAEEDAKLITSTSGDLEFVEMPGMSNANEQQPRHVIGRQRSDPAKRQLRLSLFRLPITPPTPGGQLPSFRLVHGNVENEIYLMEVTGSPTKAASDIDVTESLDDSSSDIDFTEPLNDSGSEIDFTEPLIDSGSEIDFIEQLNDSGSEIDFTEPLSSPGSDLSVEILSCSVCISADSLLICSGCARGFHRECHIPPMGPNITPGWICSLCQDLSDPSDPYGSVRLPDPLGRGLNLQDQRRCESLLLFLKVEGCSRLTEFASWALLEPIAERLRLHLEPPYQTTVDFVSDVWAVFRDASRDDALKDLQKSFRKKVKKVLGHGKPLMHTLLLGTKEDQSESRPRLGHFRKRPNSILDTKTPKKKKKTS